MSSSIGTRLPLMMEEIWGVSARSQIGTATSADGFRGATGMSGIIMHEDRQRIYASVRKLQKEGLVERGRGWAGYLIAL